MGEGKPQPRTEPEEPTSKLEGETIVPSQRERKKQEKQEKPISKREFERRLDEKYYKGPFVWSENQRNVMDRSKEPYAEISDREKRITAKNVYPLRNKLKQAGYKYDGFVGWYKPLSDNPEENKKIIEELKSFGINTRLTMETLQRRVYRGDLAGQVYDTHGPEKGQEIIDQAAQVALQKYGMI